MFPKYQGHVFGTGVQVLGRIVFMQLIIQILFITILGFISKQNNYLLIIIAVAFSCTLSAYVSYFDASHILAIYQWNEYHELGYGLFVLASTTIAYFIQKYISKRDKLNNQR